MQRKFFSLVVGVALLVGFAGCGLPFGGDDSAGSKESSVAMTTEIKEINTGLKESVLKIRTSSGVEKAFIVEIADTFSTRRIGLMHRTGMSADRGMLFVFEDTEPVAFWMKNTLIPLDMIFMDENENIVHIARNVQPCKEDPCPSYPSKRPAKYVLEINGGVSDALGIKEGDIVYLDF